MTFGIKKWMLQHFDLVDTNAYSAKSKEIVPYPDGIRREEKPTKCSAKQDATEDEEGDVESFASTLTFFFVPIPKEISITTTRNIARPSKEGDHNQAASKPARASAFDRIRSSFFTPRNKRSACSFSLQPSATSTLERIYEMKVVMSFDNDAEYEVKEVEEQLGRKALLHELGGKEKTHPRIVRVCSKNAKGTTRRQSKLISYRRSRIDSVDKHLLDGRYHEHVDVVYHRWRGGG